MDQNNISHSGRQPHFRKIRREVIRRAWKRGWKTWGYFVCKTIRGKRILMTVPKDLGGHYLCRFQLEHDARFEKRGSYGGLPIPKVLMEGVRHFIDFPPERTVVNEKPQKSLDEPKQSAKALYLGRPYEG